MADVPEPRPADDPPGLSLFEDEAAGQGREPAPPPAPKGAEPEAPAAGIRETILRFLEQEL